MLRKVNCSASFPWPESNLYAPHQWRYQHLKAAAVTVEMTVQEWRELSPDATIREEGCFLANELKSLFEQGAWLRFSQVLFSVCLQSTSLEQELVEYDR